MLQETKLNKDEIDTLNKKLGIWELEGVQAEGASGGLGVIWDARMVSFSVTSCKKN